MINIEEVPAPKAQDDKQIVQEEMETLYACLEATHERRQENIHALDTQKHELSKTILELEGNLIEHVRNLRILAIENLNIQCSKVNNELESDKILVSGLMKEVDILKKNIETAGNIDTCQQFALTKRVQSAIKKTKMMYRNSVFYGPKAVHFTENVDLLSSLLKMTELGQTHVLKKIENRSGRKKFKVKSKIWVDVRMVTDKSKCIVSDVCQLNDGTILLTDQGNKKVKRLDKEYKINDCCDLIAVPTGICCTADNEVCVKMNNNKLQFIYVGTTLVKHRETPVQDGSYYGISCFGGELWLSRRSGVSVYNTSGTLINSFERDRDGTKIFKTDTIQHMSVGGDILIVTDESDGAVCMKRDGRVCGQLRNSRLTLARGVCVSDDGTVFVSGSDNIVMFRGDGVCLGELVPKDAELRLPISLCYDRNKDCIIVSCKDSNYLYVFEFED